MRSPRRKSPKLPLESRDLPESADVVVIGAGVVGCSVAYYLAREGINVTLLEREAIGSGASAHATGSLSLLGAEFSPGASFQMARASYDEFPQLVTELEAATGMDLLYQRRPSLRLALDDEEASMIKGLMVWQQPHVEMRWIDDREVRSIEPRLSHDIIGAVYEDESAQLDSYRLNLALARGAELKGASILYREVTGLVADGSAISGVKTASGDIPCGAVVVAAGTWSRAFTSWLGFPVPVRPMKGERLLLNYPGEPLPVLISSPKRGHMISRGDGFTSVGSTGGRDYDQKELFWGEEFDRQPTETARLELLRRAIDVFPDLERAELVQQLAGSRPLSPDSKPIIGPVPGREGVLLATGHTTKGIHLGPITGRIIADYICRGSTEAVSDMSEFLPDRFADFADADFLPAAHAAEE
ncbi:MAG: FAD-dependent oxidoreductase [Chloroflexi bacterium]|nr:FAD-dependent oxidoreductase [Chloroflexota bacterium]MYE41424.1 FAD-dependent oxidoreductase [Chloroflexota bacterium]